jgi:hypothetical protein
MNERWAARAVDGSKSSRSVGATIAELDSGLALNKSTERNLLSILNASRLIFSLVFRTPTGLKAFRIICVNTCWAA